MCVPDHCRDLSVKARSVLWYFIRFKIGNRQPGLCTRTWSPLDVMCTDISAEAARLGLIVVVGEFWVQDGSVKTSCMIQSKWVFYGAIGLLELPLHGR